MGKIAFVFSGQGDQHPGMGLDLYQNYESARSVFQSADEIRPGTSTLCFEGDEEALQETKNTQPCMFAMELAAVTILSEAGIHADMTAGFSLGELAALTFSKAVNLKTGFGLVCRRGELMQRSAERQPTTMAAVLRLPSEEVERICAGFSAVYPVNYNCPGQVSVSGLTSEMGAFSSAVKEAGGRALPLKVKGGFHSRFMQEASEIFAESLKPYSLRAPEIPLYSNYTGKPYDADAKSLLAKQICNPVRWESVVQNMIDAGADTFIEIGPGRTLCNLIAKIDKTVKTFSMSKASDIDAILAGVKQ